MRAKLSILLLIPVLAATEEPAKFVTFAELVTEVVTVKDKHGKPVEGLTAQDFTITDDGKPQRIKFCEFQRLDGIAPTPAKDALLIQPSAARNQITVERTGIL